MAWCLPRSGDACLSESRIQVDRRYAESKRHKRCRVTRYVTEKKEEVGYLDWLPRDGLGQSEQQAQCCL